MANTVAGLSPVLAPVYSPINRKPINFYKPHLLSYKQNPISTLHMSRTARVIPKQRNQSFTVFGSLTDDSVEEETKDSAEGQVASIDIKLPRRSLLVEFSCKSCGERTKRLINHLAYERGLVFVEDVFGITNWLTILASLLSTTSAKPPRIWVPIKFDKLPRMS